jgi:hypothetical protein
LIELFITELEVFAVKGFRFRESGGIEAGESDGEGLSKFLIDTFLHFPELVVLDLFWREVSGLFFVEGFGVVGLFAGPRVNRSDFDLSIFVDKDVIGSDIPDLGALPMVGESGGKESVDKVPELILFEEFFVEAFSVGDLIAEQVREVVKGDVGGAAVSAETFFSVVMGDGKHEAVVGGNL